MVSVGYMGLCIYQSCLTVLSVCIVLYANYTAMELDES